MLIIHRCSDISKSYYESGHEDWAVDQVATTRGLQTDLMWIFRKGIRVRVLCVALIISNSLKQTEKNEFVIIPVQAVLINYIIPPF